MAHYESKELNALITSNIHKDPFSDACDHYDNNYVGRPTSSGFGTL